MTNFKLMSKIKVITGFMFLLCALFITACGGNSESSGVIEPTPLPLIENTNFNEFSFLKVNNPDLINDVFLDINDNSVTGRITVNVDVDNLIATFTHNGAEVNVNDVMQTSSTTGNDFTDVVTYTVETTDGAQKNYQVDLTKFTGLPIVYLSTDNNVLIDSKDDYVAGSVSLDGGRYTESMQSTTMKIRGR